MTHLKCVTHNRRVQLVDDTAEVIHRGGNASIKCETESVTIGGRLFSPQEVIGKVHQSKPEEVKQGKKKRKQP